MRSVELWGLDGCGYGGRVGNPPHYDGALGQGAGARAGDYYAG